MPFSEQLRNWRERGSGKQAKATATLDLQTLTALDVATCAGEIEALAVTAASREDAAGRLVGYFYDRLRTGEGLEPACALVRCFQTCRLEELPAGRREFAIRQLGSMTRRENVRCLALLATRGIEPQWDGVAGSTGHQAIPLPSVEVILKTPMIARLLLQMGVRYEHVVAPPEGGEFLIDRPGDSLNIFHVARARGSQYIPAQASFVHKYGIRSVLGLGGLSPAGELFVTVLFTRVPVSRETAELFRGLSSAARAVLMRFPAEQTFALPA